MSTTRPSTTLAWGLGLINLAAMVTTIALMVVDDATTVSIAGAPPHTTQFTVLGALLAVLVVGSFALAGGVVAGRLPGNPIGWFLCGIAVLVALDFLAESAFWHDAARGEPLGSVATVAGWYQNWFWVPVVVMGLSGLPLLFPSGTPPAPGWRAVGWLAVGAGGIVLVDGMVSSGQLENVAWDQENPFGLVAIPQAVPDTAMALWGLSVLLAVASVIVRFRRSHGVERAQLKWFVLAIALAVVLYLLNIPFDAYSAVLLSGAALSVVAAVAIAVLRYRLYDIDLVINRAIVYGSLTLALGAAYLVTVLLLLVVLQPLTSGSQLAVAVSTLAVAGLFRPARATIQRRVDRRFFRRRYDAGRTLAAFGLRMRDEIDVEELAGELRAVVRESVQPAEVSLWLQGGW